MSSTKHRVHRRRAYTTARDHDAGRRLWPLNGGTNLYFKVSREVTHRAYTLLTKSVAVHSSFGQGTLLTSTTFPPHYSPTSSPRCLRPAIEQTLGSSDDLPYNLFCAIPYTTEQHEDETRSLVSLNPRKLGGSVGRFQPLSSSRF